MFKEKATSPDSRPDSSPELKLTVLIKMKMHRFEWSHSPFWMKLKLTIFIQFTTTIVNLQSQTLKFSSHNCERSSATTYHHHRSQLIAITWATDHKPTQDSSKINVKEPIRYFMPKPMYKLKLTLKNQLRVLQFMSYILRVL